MGKWAGGRPILRLLNKNCLLGTVRADSRGATLESRVEGEEGMNVDECGYKDGEAWWNGGRDDREM
jgi:hypothetical protein